MLASVASMIEQFNITNLNLLLQLGCEVHVACNFEEGSTYSHESNEKLKNKLALKKISHYQVDFSRDIRNVKQLIRAYHQVLDLMQKQKYDLLHCHSPIGGAISRLAAHNMKIPAIYTVHGFHFYKGAPLKNWLIYYPVERLLARYTDVLITINQEDYKNARKFRAKRVVYMPGIGINTTINNTTDIKSKRIELEIPENAFLMLSVGELNRNKNHEVIIKAMGEIENKNLYYIICGQGKNFAKLQKLIQTLRLKDQVKLLGFRSDIKEIYPCADVFVHPSYREGLSVALMEAMSYGIPCIVSAIRGNTDLIDNNLGGYTVKTNNKKGFKKAILKVVNNKTQEFGKYNQEKIKNFSEEKVTQIMCKVYSDEFIQNISKNV